MTGDLADRQLRVIGEIAKVASAAGLDVWLRGGWAMDFFLGEVTRPHVDVDWFCWRTDVERLTGLLHERGYTDEFRVPPDRQRDLIKNGVAPTQGPRRHRPAPSRAGGGGR